jgi:hypothetical protein
LFRGIPYGSWDVTAMVVTRGLSQLEDITMEGPHSQESLQWRQRRPDFVEAHALNHFHQQIATASGCEVLANLWDRDGTDSNPAVDRK